MRPAYLVLLYALVILTKTSAGLVEYSDLALSHPTDGSLNFLGLGDKFSGFARKAPAVLDPQFLQEFGAQGYLHANFNPLGENAYETSSVQYVASLKNASICGSEGDVWDSAGRLYRANTWVRHPSSKLQAWKEEAESYGVKHFKRLATAVHRVSFMYFHFMTEVLPKVAKFAPFLEADPELKLLTYGSPFELAWIRKLGVRESQLVTFDPMYAYQADELLMTNPVEISRTPKEDLEKVLTALEIPPPLPESQQESFVYVSRRLAADRRQTNEDSLLEALQAEATSHGLRFVVHDGSPGMTPEENIEIFRHAKVVMGPNGAGLAHMLFAPPGATLIELMFINNTGMDLWHLTAALKQDYYMVPLPRSHWLDPGSDVPIEQAVSTLRWAIGEKTGAKPECPKGSAPDASGTCALCPPGTFSTGYDKQCMACSPGWVAERTGSGYCHVCTTATHASGPTSCTSCPQGTLTAMPGSTNAGECLDPDSLTKVKQTWLPTEAVVSKVSAYYKSISRRQAVKVDFSELPLRVKDRIMSELDACSSYTQTMYGCSSAAEDSSPPPVAVLSKEFNITALGNGPLSNCSVMYYDSYMTLQPTGVTTDKDGNAKLKVTVPSDLVLLSLANCVEQRSNRSGLSFTGVYAPWRSNGVSIVSPIGGLTSTAVSSKSWPTASAFNANYTTILGELGFTSAMIKQYGNSGAEVAAYDFEDATYHPDNNTEKTMGAYMTTQQLTVYGIANIWVPFLAGMSKSGSKIGSRRATRALLSSMTTQLGARLLNMSSSSSQQLMFQQAYRLLGSSSQFRRHLLDADSDALAAVASQIQALADSVSQSVALQAAVAAKLADAVASGTAYSGDLQSLLITVNQVSVAQATSIAAAAAELSAGTLSVDSFRASYTGDSLTQLIKSITVDLPDSEEDKKKINVGAIVGGVVGGVVGLAVIGLIVYVIIRRKKAHIQPKAQGGQAAAGGGEQNA
ncbi:hypothetical protein Agub_g13507 [Astrephomene gubernaculifera]|uniref:Glycosyltransferase 61 catalytic domain-containing protein n=1 Tax=Astrephomene gubernaculifera TaxID=47775 RepID=A0AAD3E1H4_9CHLO|nr:hypothetical protein Agub_g13507 [Astrephomene gubernaculifera]